MTEEGQVRHSFPAWRIFVFGVEVTNDVVSCNTNWHDGRSPGTAEFTLASERDRYIVTPRDIYAMYADISNAVLTSADDRAKAITEEINKRIEHEIVDETKQRVLKAKVAERLHKQEQEPPLKATLDVLRALGEAVGDTRESAGRSIKTLAYLRGDILRFPFTVGQCIFHTGDPCRIFWRDPFSPKDWYFEATGSISDWKESGDANGRRTISLTVEDATRPLRMARVALNPAIYDVNAVLDKELDEAIRNWHVDLFYDKTFAQMMEIILFGNDALPASSNINQFRYSVHDKTPIKNVNVKAVGYFNRFHSKTYIWGPKTEAGQTPRAVGSNYTHLDDESLEAWQDAIDHKVELDVDDLLTLCIPDKREEERALLEADVGVLQSVDEVIKRIGEHPEIYPVDFGRLMMLLPASLGPGGNLSVFLKDLRNGVADQTETMTRLQIIYNTCQRLNFSFYATPRGDLVCEMPLSDMRPETFGKYKDRYKFQETDTISFESHFEHDKVRTLLIADYAIVAGYQDLGYASRLWIKPGAKKRIGLVPQFGLVAERAEPWAYNNSEKAAEYYAEIKLSQMNADAWMQSIQTMMHLGVGPNRPCWFAVRDFIATTRSVGNAIAWGGGGSSGNVSQQLKLNYRRGWSGALRGPEQQEHVYEPYGGEMTNPLNYAKLFQFQKEEVTQSTKEFETSLSQPEREQLLANEDYTKQQAEKLRILLEQRISKSINQADWKISIIRSPSANAAAKGKPNSRHLDGLAMDIQNLPDLRKNYGITADMIVDAIRYGQAIEGFAKGYVQMEANHKHTDVAAIADHVHWQIDPDGIHKRLSHKK